jgi:hypothetical protein
LFIICSFVCHFLAAFYINKKPSATKRRQTAEKAGKWRKLRGGGRKKLTTTVTAEHDGKYFLPFVPRLRRRGQ